MDVVDIIIKEIVPCWAVASSSAHAGYLFVLASPFLTDRTITASQPHTSAGGIPMHSFGIPCCSILSFCIVGTWQTVW